MATVEEAQTILKALGMPPAQHNRMSGLTLIALCGLMPNSTWKEAKRARYTITKGIMSHLTEHYGVVYAPNTRETIRRQVLHQLVQGRIADYNPFEPNLATNSPRAHYTITEAALKAVRFYGSEDWDDAVHEFHSSQGSLLEIYDHNRNLHMVPVRLPDGQNVELSPGKHNDLQKNIIEQFAPRFAPGSDVLYLGDTAKKQLIIDKDKLDKLGVPITDHNKLPDVVLYDRERNRLLFIEAVTSHGPMSPKRVVELEDITSNCDSVAIFVSAFLNFAEFRRHSKKISWDTEVWISDQPDHMIHYNGDRFLESRS